MIRATVVVLGLVLVPYAQAEMMLCDETRQCSLVCYFPSAAARTEPVYPVTDVAVYRVRVDPVGDDNLMYTAERRDSSATMPTFQPLESFILPKDYPCRLSPAELLQGNSGPATAEAVVGSSAESSN